MNIITISIMMSMASILVIGGISTTSVFGQGGCGTHGCSSGSPGSGFTGGFGTGGSPSETPSGNQPPIQGGGGGFGGLDQPKFGGVPCGGGSGGAQISGSDGQYVGGGGGGSC